MKERPGFAYTIVFIILLFGLVSPGLAADDSLSERIASALQSMAGGRPDRVAAAFGSFTYEETGMSGTFAVFLEELLAGAMNRSNVFDLIVMEAVENVDSAFRDAFADPLVERGAEYVLRGRSFDEGKTARVCLELDSLAAGCRVETAEVFLPKAEMPESVSLIPPQQDCLRELRRDLVQVIDFHRGFLDVQVTTNRGAGGVFRNGDELTLHVLANRDTWIKVYHVDADGELVLIFPNECNWNNWVFGGEPLTIPSAGDSYSLLMEAPYGTEFIKVVASTGQFRRMETPFAGLGSAREYFTDLAVIGIREGTATNEAMVSYSVVEGW